MAWFPLAVVALIVLRLGAQLALEALNRAESRRHAGARPAAVADVMDEPTYAKSVDYTLAKSRFASVEGVWEVGVLLALLFSGALPAFWHWCNGLAPGAAWSGALFLAGTMILLGLPSLPLGWWAQFRLEERFGFNKSTYDLWFMDQLKATVLGLAIGFPIAWGLLALVGWVGAWWWVWGFVLIFVVQILGIVFTKPLIRIFNKLTPLPDGEQRARLLALADRTGFSAQTIDVMDGSKRSGHSNAFFTGFGRLRRIVLYDTLIEQLGQEELEAVLAHEIGHYKLGHIPKSICVGVLKLFVIFAIISLLVNAPWFNAAFGLPSGILAPTLLLFALFYGAVTFWFDPLSNRVSRKHEYEADAFAKNAMGSATPMIGALRKLSQKNLANLTPHPLYSAVYYSHPTLVERERALQG